MDRCRADPVCVSRSSVTRLLSDMLVRCAQLSRGARAPRATCGDGQGTFRRHTTGTSVGTCSRVCGYEIGRRRK